MPPITRREKNTLSFTLTFQLCSADYEGNGEGGIRTLGSLLGYGALAKRCFRPLSHLTKMFYITRLRLFVAAENWEL